jgi:hypothetical protein
VLWGYDAITKISTSTTPGRSLGEGASWLERVGWRVPNQILEVCVRIPDKGVRQTCFGNIQPLDWYFVTSLRVQEYGGVCYNSCPPVDKTLTHPILSP